MTPAAILTEALKPFSDVEIGRLAHDVGVPGHVAMRAARGGAGPAINIGHHVKLCAWRGVDPMTGVDLPGLGRRLVRFDTTLFAMAVKMARFAKRQNQRQAARDAGISLPVVSRIENGDARSVETVIAAARYAGIDPRNYIVDVSREPAIRNTLIPQAKATA